jgi:hypothetical protein
MANRLLAMLMNDDQVAMLEPIGVVQVEGPTQVPLVVQKFVLVFRAFESVACRWNEAFADLDRRERWLPPIGERSSDLEAQTAVIRLEDLQVLVRAGLGDADAVPLEELDNPGDIVVELVDTDIEQGSARRGLRSRNLLPGPHLDPAPHPSADDGARRNGGSGLESVECRSRNSDDPVGDTNCSQVASSDDPGDGVMADIEPIRDLFDGIPSLLGHCVTCVPVRGHVS